MTCLADTSEIFFKQNCYQMSLFGQIDSAPYLAFDSVK